MVCKVAPSEIAGERNYAILERARTVVGRAHLIVKNPSESLSDVVDRALSEKYAAIVLNHADGTLDRRLIGRAVGQGVALVSVDRWVDGIDNIVIDRQVGTRQAARLMIGAGRCRVRLFSASDLKSPDARLIGFVEGFSDSGCRLTEEHIIRIGGSDVVDGYEIARRVLADSSDRPDALFCYSDQMAIGVMRAAVDAGIPVGSDLWLVGFDDLLLSRYLPVSLTTVSQPVKPVADAVVELVRTRLDEPSRIPRVRRFSTTLVIRESAPLPERLSREIIYGRGR